MFNWPCARRAGTLALLSLSASGCETPKIPAQTIILEVVSDPGVPLPDVGVAVGSVLAGRTGADGRATLVLEGRELGVAEISVQCPEGHRAPERPLEVRLRPQRESQTPAVYDARCAPEQRTVVLAVRAEGGRGVPLTLLGKELARVDEFGVAHAQLRAAPGATFEFALDTSDQKHAALRPQTPVMSVSVPDHDAVVVFDQAFSRLEPKHPARVKRAREPVGPVQF